MYTIRYYIKETIYTIPTIICLKLVSMTHLLQSMTETNIVKFSIIDKTTYNLVTSNFSLTSLQQFKIPVKFILQVFEYNLVKFGLYLVCLFKFYEFKMVS